MYVLLPNAREVEYVRQVCDWLLAAEQNFNDMQMDWSRLVDMCSGKNLFVPCHTPHQWRFLLWTRSDTSIARYNNWLMRTRRTSYTRGILSDFHNLELIHRTNSAARRAFPSYPPSGTKGRPCGRCVIFRAPRRSLTSGTLSSPGTTAPWSAPVAFVIHYGAWYYPSSSGLWSKRECITSIAVGECIA